MIFRFETMKNKTKSDTKRTNPKRLQKDLREALTDTSGLGSPTVSTVAITITAVTVYPY